MEASKIRSEVSDIDSLIHRITSETNENKSLDIVNEMINETGDDRTNILPGDKVVLVVEDDLRFGRIMLERAHQEGLKSVIAMNYIEVFDFITRFVPIAITLDVKLPDTSGWRVLELIRNDFNYRHIPVHLISGEENKVLALKRGARSFHLKPLNNASLDDLFSDIISYNKKETRNVLVVEDNELDSSQIAKMLKEDSIKVTVADTGKKALDVIETSDVDCIILDYSMPDISGSDLVKKINESKGKLTPVIVYSAKDFNKAEMNQLNGISNYVLLKGVNSLEQLLEQTILQLHINPRNLAKEKQSVIQGIRKKQDILSGKNILVVDDDVRNLFALTTVFERYNINAITAESGAEAITLLNENPNIDMVLMDIMMPEMDGYETMQKIRREHRNNSLPIIAVTAKAMKGDRNKCIEAGASDYITKPLKIDQLLSLMRVWFFK